MLYCKLVASTRENISIEVSFTYVGLILTKPGTRVILAVQQHKSKFNYNLFWKEIQIEKKFCSFDLGGLPNETMNS